MTLSNTKLLEVTHVTTNAQLKQTLIQTVELQMIWKVVKSNIYSGWSTLCFICTSYFDSTVLSQKNQAFRNRFIRQIQSLQNQEN